MIQVFRNPFAMRASEKITDDVLFLRLFSSESLALLRTLNEKGQLWGNVIRLNSAPGGGKTSLLRIFSPSVLKELILQNVSQDNLKLVDSQLRELEVIKENDIRKCGVYLLTERDYELLWKISDVSELKKRQLIFSLLNARICLAVLKSIMILCSINNRELKKVQFRPNDYDLYALQLGLPSPCNCYDLYLWAEKVESGICDYIEAATEEIPVGSSSIFAFELFSARNFIYEGMPKCEEFIYMLDDVHKFGPDLFRLLVEQIVEKRVSGTTIFLACRKEVLPMEDVMPEHNKEKRDYINVDLEDRDRSKVRRIFEQISASRSMLSIYNVSLWDSLDDKITTEYDSKYQKIIEDSKKNIEQLNASQMLSDWMESIDNSNERMEEKAIMYKAFTIYAAREVEKRGISLFPLDVNQMRQSIDANLCNLASLLMKSQYGLPIYYGIETMVDVASSNAEQYITFANEIYDGLIGKVIKGDIHRLSAKEQDAIIHEVSKQEYQKIRLLPHGKQITIFLNHLMDYCYGQTHSKTASYRILTGFAVATEKTGEWFRKEENRTLAEIIRICIANNLLTMKRVNQGNVGEEWTVFYLNRFLCVYKNIPLAYGGWRKLLPAKLNSWLQEK